MHSFLKDLFIFFGWALPACVSVQHMHVGECLWRSEEGLRSAGSRVTDGGEPPCGCWEVNPVPVQEQRVLFDPRATSLDPIVTILIFVVFVIVIGSVLSQIFKYDHFMCWLFVWSSVTQADFHQGWP